jgi:transposase
MNQDSEPADQALGRSRGGLSTKVHLAGDGRGLPLSIVLTGGQAGDNPQLLPVLDGIAAIASANWSTCAPAHRRPYFTGADSDSSRDTSSFWV